MAEQKTYRHEVTGLVGAHPVTLAKAFPKVLTEVAPGTKNRAFSPISPEAVDTVIAARVAEPNDDFTTGTASDSAQPDTSSTPIEVNPARSFGKRK